MQRLLIAFAACAAASGVFAADASLPQFIDITRQAGISFHHINGLSPDKHLVETMGSGGLLFDYDGDGWLDILLVDGGSLADPAVDRTARHRLYHNRRNGTFEDVTERSGIERRDYGMGACSADYDGDGRPDLYITSFGANTLYRNRGDGTFADVTARARVGWSKWSAGCAFADLDNDGDLDLFVANYVDVGRQETPYCGDAKLQRRFYCHPLNFTPLPNTLYRNDGNGQFTDVSVSSRIASVRSNGLGVVVDDYDGDGWLDVFVANDSVPNALFHNERRLRFEDAALGAGIAVASDGKARAGMGIDTGDYDGDGRLDVLVTNLDFEMHTLHRGVQDGLFAYATTEAGIGFATLPFVGFGAAFLDFDNDARLDLAIANGHIMDNAPEFRAGSVYAQRKLLFHNTTGRRFAEVGRDAGPGFALEKVGRGLAAGDIDNDGDLDLLVTNSGQTADLLRNDQSTPTNALLVKLRGAAKNIDAIGSRIRVTTGPRTQTRTIKAGSSYLSQNDLRAHFGLGAATMIDRIDVQWPDGKMESVRSVAANQIVTIAEGKGIVTSAKFEVRSAK